MARAEEVYRKGDRSLDLGLWLQGWYQYVQDATDRDGDGRQEHDGQDFLVRRTYLYAKGTVTPWLGFFVHVAGDRLGQRGLDNPGEGLGTGSAVRDGWVSIRLLDGVVNLHVGRMYIPFTRNYGTTSTKTLLTTDLDWTQGGYRGGIFYPSKVGRDDGVTLWGNIASGLLQYRVMVGDGADDVTRNPVDHPRVAGRLSLSLFDRETNWFNEGSYLGKRRVLSIGGGVDVQRLVFDADSRRYVAWTVDVHVDQSLRGGAVTFESSYTHIDNSPNAVGFTAIASGTDANVISSRLGYLISCKLGPGQLQPFGSYERINVDDTTNTTHVAGIGSNYFLDGHANKLSVEATYVAQAGNGSAPTPPLQGHLLVTVQVAAGL